MLACVLPASRAVAQQQQPTTYPVRGIVVNSLTHTPIARALVEAQADAVLTDSNGRFELELPAGTTLPLSARRPGYVTGGSATHIVRVGEGLTDLTLALTPQAVITGHISSSSGDDAEGTRVMAYRRRTRRNQQWWEAQGSAVTDSGGHFRFSNLQTPAEYLLVTLPTTDREGRANANASTYGYPATFYPEGAETSATGLMPLAPGQQANVEMSLNRQPFFPVAIQVRNDVGATPLSVQIHDETGLATDFPAQWNAQKRMAQAELPNGRYVAEIHSYNQPELYGSIEFTVASTPVMGLSAVVLPLHPVLVEIHRNFVSNAESNQAGDVLGGLRNQNFRGAQLNPGMNITLIPADSAAGPVGSLQPVPHSADSMLFQLEGVTPGRYWVRTNAFEGYVSSITSGGVDLAREPLTVGPGNTTPPLEVELHNDGGQIHGTLHDALRNGSSDAALVSIFAIPTSPSTGPALASIGSGTDFAISGVPPGSYSVIALVQQVDIDALEPSVLNTYLSKGQTVSVEAQGSANVTLDVIHADDAGGGTEVAQ